MNYKWILKGILVFSIVLFSACGDDEPSLRERFSFEDRTLSVKDANVFLTYDGSFDGRTERDYLVTDGTYDSEEDAFAGATYFIWVYLVEEEDEEDLRTGNYPNWDNWNDAAVTSRISYVEAQSTLDEDDENYFEFYTLPDAQGEDAVKASGGFDVGETITLKYSGDLNYYHLNNGDQWVNETASGNFMIKGEIQNLLSSGPARKRGRASIQ